MSLYKLGLVGTESFNVVSLQDLPQPAGDVKPVVRHHLELRHPASDFGPLPGWTSAGSVLPPGHPPEERGGHARHVLLGCHHRGQIHLHVLYKESDCRY